MLTRGCARQSEKKRTFVRARGGSERLAHLMAADHGAAKEGEAVGNWLGSLEHFPHDVDHLVYPACLK